jgi:hypothetical protein
VLQSWDDSHTFEIEALMNERTQPEAEKLVSQTRAYYDSLTPAGQNESEAWSKFAESESTNSLGEPPVSHIAAPKTKVESRWKFLWFALHLATVYVLVQFATPWLAGWTYGKFLPFVQIHTSPSVYEFEFSHVFMFSFTPALIAGVMNARFKHKAALLVWIVPTAVLVYKLATFSSPHSVLYSSSSSPVWHYYFGGDFFIPQFHSWREFWDAAGSNPDMARGMAQLTFTAPFYAGFAYSLAAWISRRLDLAHKGRHQSGKV